MEELNFSLELKEIPVMLKGKDGVKRNYILRELTGTQRDKFLNDISTRLKFSDGKINQVTNFDRLQSNFLTLCLFDEENEQVPVDTLQTYPAGVLTELFKAAQQISGLDLTEEELKKLKN